MKKIMLLLLVLCILNCAPKINFVTPTGQTAPFPSYSLSSTGLNIHTTFYYTTNKGVKDVDGTVVQESKYLNLFNTHDIYLSSKQSLTLTIEVYNPEEIEYRLQERASYHDRKNIKTETSGNLGYSKLKYRKFVFDLPVTHKIKDMNYSVMLQDEKGNILFICGPFGYNVIM